MDNRSKPLSNSEAPTIDAGATVGGAPARVLDLSATLISDEGPASAATSSLQFGGFVERGTVLAGRYEILENLGRGGMGEVYKAADREVGRLVALKVIRPELASSPAVIQRFKQELILAHQVTHRNVIRIYDLGEGGGKKFITMEYIEGETLTSLLQRHGKLPSANAARIIQQVCLALDAAHSEGVIHRDLKPGNIMQDKEGRILVMDFGLAHSEQAAEPLPIHSTTAEQYPQIQAFAYQSQPGTLVGTVAYMAPEQALAQEVDARTDLFALGIVFYELLTGKMPYQANTPERMLLARKQQKAKPITEVDPNIPRALAKIVMRCLETERGDRYQSAKGVLADLETWLHPTRKALKWSAAAVAVFLLVGAQMVLQQRFTHKPGAQHAPVSVLVADFANETGESVFDGTLEPALGVALEGASFISEYNRSAAHKLAAQLHPGATTLDEPLARLVATRDGINVVLAGSIARQGERYIISWKAVDPVTGNTMMISNVTAANKDAVLRAVNTLAARVRASLGDVTSESVQIAQAETFTSSSLPTAHQYATAMDLQWAGKYDDAIQAFKRTIEMDPNMGRAYAGIGTILGNRGDQPGAIEYYKLALAHIDGMSEREKYRTRGAYYLHAREPEKAEEELNKLVQLFPADSAGAANLALAYFYLRDMPKALKEGRRAVEISPKNVPQRNNLGLYAMYAGDFATAIKEQQAVLELNPKFERAYVGLALSQFAEGQTAQAKETYARLAGVSALGGSLSTAGLEDLALAEGRARDALPIIEKGIAADLQSKSAESAARGMATLAQAHLLLGERGQALEAADRAVATSAVDNVKFLAGEIYLEAGRASKALVLADHLGNSIETDSQAYAKVLQGESAFEHGKPQDALRLFQDARKIADTWLGRYEMARVYVALGAFTEADSELENCLQRRGEATALFLDEVPTYHLLPSVYYYLGRAQEGLKSPAAADSFKTFLAMKEKAERDPLVLDAHRRMGSR